MDWLDSTCTNASRLHPPPAARSAAVDQPPTWEQLRRLGAGFWLRDPGLLAATAEQLAKQQFAARRSADDCALLYCALGKRSVLQVGAAALGGRHDTRFGVPLHLLGCAARSLVGQLGQHA